VSVLRFKTFALLIANLVSPNFHGGISSFYEFDISEEFHFHASLRIYARTSGCFEKQSVRIEILERTSLVMYLLCMYVCVVHLIVCRELLCS